MTEPSAQPLTEYILKRVRKLVDGNGATPGDVSLLETKEEIYSLPAVMLLTPYAEQSLKEIKGSPLERPHHVTDNRIELDRLAQNIRQDEERIQNCLTAGLEKIRSSSHSGWGYDNERITLPELDSVICCSEACAQCQGQGQQSCSNCRGQKNITCAPCHGRGDQRCQQCGGSGKTLAAGGDPQICNQCQGRTIVQCRICQGRGVTACPRCNASGKSRCAGCEATGIVSAILTVQFAALARFQIQPQAFDSLPDYVAAFLKRIGAARLKGDIATIEISDVEQSPQSCTIHYKSQFPFAQIKLQVKDKKFDFSAIGHKPKLAACPNFLDHLIEPALNELKLAAQNKDSMAHFKTALKFPVVQQALKNSKNAAELHKFYHQALSLRKAEDIFAALKNIFAQLNRIPSRIAGGIGLAVSLAVFLVYFFVFRKTPWPFHGQDIIPLALTLLLQFFLLQFGSFLVVASRLKRSGIQLSRNLKPLSTFGKTEIALLAGVGILYGAVALLAGLKGIFSF